MALVRRVRPRFAWPSARRGAGPMPRAGLGTWPCVVDSSLPAVHEAVEVDRQWPRGRRKCRDAVSALQRIKAGASAAAVADRMILDEILAHKRREIRDRRQARPLSKLRDRR